MSATTNDLTTIFPADVLEFAAKNEVTHLLMPIWSGVTEYFTQARGVEVKLEHDPEVRDLTAVHFLVRIPPSNPEESWASRQRWWEVFSALCPPRFAHLFVVLRWVEEQ